MPEPPSGCQIAAAGLVALLLAAFGACTLSFMSQPRTDDPAALAWTIAGALALLGAAGIVVWIFKAPKR